MSVKILFIGDPHIQVNNIPEVEIFMERLINLATKREPDLIIIAGDLLHTHERLHTLALNKAYEMVNDMRLIAKTYVLVGNHDYIQNQQFLTQNHWMTGLKEWKNTVIVDTVLSETIRGEKFIFVLMYHQEGSKRLYRPSMENGVMLLVYLPTKSLPDVRWVL